MSEKEKETVAEKKKEILAPKKFTESLQKMEKFVEIKEETLKIDEVAIPGGFLGLGSHKVTGEEFNNRVEAIGNNLIALNNADIAMKRQFREIYKALDSLDKEYIHAILTNIKSIERTSEGVQNAQERIGKIVSGQEKTLRILNNFKGKLDELEHLKEIDIIWEDCRRWHEDTKELARVIDAMAEAAKEADKKLQGVENHAQGLEAALGMVSADLGLQIERIDGLIAFVSELKKMVHLKEIDGLWEKSRDQEHRLGELADIADSLRADLTADEQAIGANEQKIAENKKAIEAVEAAVGENEKAIDKNKDAIAENKAAIDENKASIAKNESAIDRHQALIEENQDEIEENQEAIEKQGKQLETQDKLLHILRQQAEKNQLDLLEAVAEEKEKREAAMRKLAKAQKIAFIIAGSGVGIAIIELVLLLLKVL